MGQQRGTFYWDDDSLSPGTRPDGSWSQNLFDDDGSLRAHARFMPDFGPDSTESVYSPHSNPPMFMSSEARLESDDEEEVESEDSSADSLAILLTTLVGAAAVAGTAYAAPRIKKWATGTAVPFIKGSLSKVRMPWGKKQDEEIAPEETGVTHFRNAEIDPGTAGSHAPLGINAKRQTMSNAEAQARLVAAAAAQLFAEEQTRLVMRADVVNATDVDDLRRQLATHPHDELEKILQHLARNPRLLEDGSLAELASFLDYNSARLDTAQQQRAPLPHAQQSPCTPTHHTT